jgi:ComF family protein
LDLLYPRICGGCGGEVGPEAQGLCWECRSQVIYVRSPFCRLCGDPVEGRIDGEFACYTCSSQSIHFDRARSATRYDGVMRRALCDFKYRAALWLQRDLVDILEACFHAQYPAEEIDGVAYVPMYHAKRRARGFNQARYLARDLAGRLHKPLLSGIVKRVTPSPTQTNLTARERRANVATAFRAGRSGRLRGRRVLLVDDVMTTGATVDAVSRELKKGGVQSVSVLTVARG